MSQRDDRTPNRPEVAVALSYDGEGVPKVVARGKGVIAEELVSLAQEHDVPLHEDAELSAALAQIELGREIPPQLYQAVAEVLSFALYVSGKHEEILQKVHARRQGKESRGKE
ncbi:MAG: EscU/YscU/HrcU family type III secretion system export apparatus switch protein [Halothiobacillaceae bacterium]